MIPKVPGFESGCFSEMVCSVGDVESGCPSNFTQNNGVTTHRVSRNAAHVQEHLQNSENDILETSLSGKRRRNISLGAPFKKAEKHKQRDLFKDTESRKGGEMNNGHTNLLHVEGVDKAQENGGGGEPAKENYLHMRAKRGQAISSHSLAERVRRERISDRMKFLQELVPGCNKITGKALMLDEIINYVQSLQHQVEFLSMKLATVNRELDVDLEQILSKHIINLQGGNGTSFEIGQGLSLSHAFPGYSHGNIHGFRGTTTPFHSLTQNIWNGEIQRNFQMGFSSDQTDQNEISRMEL